MGAALSKFHPNVGDGATYIVNIGNGTDRQTGKHKISLMYRDPIGSNKIHS